MTQIYHPGNQREDVPVYWLLDLTPHIRHEGVTKSPLGTTMLTALSLSSPLSLQEILTAVTMALQMITVTE